MDKQGLIAALRRTSANVPYVVRCASGCAVIRCAPNETDEVIGLMGREMSSASLMTSGTLKALRSKVPELAEHQRGGAE